MFHQFLRPRNACAPPAAPPAAPARCAPLPINSRDGGSCAGSRPVGPRQGASSPILLWGGDASATGGEHRRRGDCGRPHRGRGPATAMRGMAVAPRDRDAASRSRRATAMPHGAAQGGVVPFSALPADRHAGIAIAHRDAHARHRGRGRGRGGRGRRRRRSRGRGRGRGRRRATRTRRRAGPARVLAVAGSGAAGPRKQQGLRSEGPYHKAPPPAIPPGPPDVLKGLGVVYHQFARPRSARAARAATPAAPAPRPPLPLFSC